MIILPAVVRTSLLSAWLCGLVLAGAASEARADCLAQDHHCDEKPVFERLTQLPAVPDAHGWPVQRVRPMVQLAGWDGETYYDDGGRPYRRQYVDETRPQPDLRDSHTRALDPLEHRASELTQELELLKGGTPATNTDVPVHVPTANCPVQGPTSWTVARGDSLVSALACWSQQADWQLSWLAEHEYILGASADFQGPFEKAAGNLLAAFAAAEPPVFAEFHRGNRVLVVTTPIEQAHQ